MTLNNSRRSSRLLRDSFPTVARMKRSEIRNKPIRDSTIPGFRCASSGLRVGAYTPLRENCVNPTNNNPNPNIAKVEGSGTLFMGS